MRVPDANTYPPESVKDRATWYQFMTNLANGLPQTGSVLPENNIKANASCMYLQTTAGVTKLWVNETGNGSLTGWVMK